MRLPRESGEQWSFREDGPQGYIELKAHQHSVVFYFAKTPDLEELGTKTVCDSASRYCERILGGSRDSFLIRASDS